jgi:fructokinase
LSTTMILLLSMERIVLGGGVMQRPLLLPKIRVRTQQLLNNYVPLDKDALDRMIVVSAHGKDAGYVSIYYCCGGDDSCAIVESS